MRHACRFGLALAVLFVVAGPVQAQRRGFIIGGGLGTGFTGGGFDRKAGLTTEFKIGGMIGESIQLYYANRVNWARSVIVDVEGTGVGGLGVTFQMPNNVRLNGLIGLANWVAFSNDISETQSGFGAGVGVGLEVAKHWVVGLDGSYGRIEGRNLLNLGLTINILSY